MITIHPLLLGIFLYMKEKTSNSSYLQQHQVLQEDRGLRGIRRGPFKRREMRLRECANCQWWDLISLRSSAESTAGNLAGDLGPARRRVSGSETGLMNLMMMLQISRKELHCIPLTRWHKI